MKERTNSDKLFDIIKGDILNPKDYAWPFASVLLYKEEGDSVKALECGGGH